MKNKIVYLLFAAALVLSACAARASAPTYAVEPSVDLRSPGVGGGAQEYEGIAPAPQVSQPSGGETDNSAAVQDRLIIMNVDLTIVVADPEAKVDEITQMADQMGGFVVSMNMYQTTAQSGEKVPQGYISIRVPAESLDRAINQIKADAVEVPNETRSGQDVTQEYVDRKSRLRNLEAAEAELEEIMQNATDTQDVLDVFNQLEYYREQIEIVKGQMQYYEQASSYSLINVTLIAEETVKPIVIGGWRPEGVAREAIQKLINFLEGFVDFLIRFFLYYLWVLVIIFGPFVGLGFGIAAIVRRARRKKTPPQAKS